MSIFAPRTLHAQVTAIEITNRQPYEEGAGAIPYEKLTGYLYGDADPDHAGNKIITDLTLAPLNDRGNAEYKADFVLLKPIDMNESNGVLHYMAPNRGRRISPVDSVLLAEGAVFLWSAWQGDVDDGQNRLQLSVPLAKNADGTSISGTVLVEFIASAGRIEMEMPLQGNAYNSGQKPYPPASYDNANAILTKRIRETDARVFIPNDRWSFAGCDAQNPFPGTKDAGKICLKGGFEPNHLYELVYEAKDPFVMGLGLAAVRDAVSFFRYESSDLQGNENPLRDRITHAMGSGISQAGNFMKTLVHLGFNENLQSLRVFDALLPVVAARQTNINMRFSVPGGGGGIRGDHRAFGQSSVRGFAPDYQDKLQGITGGIFRRCSESNTCPLTFLALSGAEMWVLQGSPVLTNVFGTRDLEQPDNLRIYYFAGAQHGTSSVRWNPDFTLYPSGVQSTFDAILRALRVRLQEWMMYGTTPPASEVPRIADGTLIRPEELEYPVMKGVEFSVNGEMREIPEFEYLGWYNSLGLLDYGPRYQEHEESGIAEWRPPHYLGKDYAIMVAAVDELGNEVGGLQPVGNAVPLGTNLPYNYNTNLALGDLFWLSGSFIPFHITKEERLTAGDERLSLEELYGDQATYVERVKETVRQLSERGFLLPEDATQILKTAMTLDIFQK